MGKAEVWVRPDVARQIRNSPEMQAILKAEVDRIAAAANASLSGDSEGFEASVSRGPARARARVRTTDAASMLHNSKTNAILKALGG